MAPTVPDHDSRFLLVRSIRRKMLYCIILPFIRRSGMPLALLRVFEVGIPLAPWASADTEVVPCSNIGLFTAHS
jgi:hypothetical protein